MTETVIINRSTENAGPSLEETARSMGIDPATVDSTDGTQEAPAPKILGKFSDQAALEKAYKELEKKLSSRDPKLASESVEADPNALPSDEGTAEVEGEEVEKTAEETAKETVEAAGLDFNKYTAEWNEKGVLSEESFAELESKGNIPKEMVEQFIEGQVAVRELTRQSVFTEAGGEDSYWSMIEWAGKSLDAKEATAFNEAVEGRDRVAANMAVKGLKARYEAENGREPARTVSGKPARGDTATYESVSQMQKDMNDPRYWKDAAFRSKVEAKLARSNIL